LIIRAACCKHVVQFVRLKDALPCITVCMVHTIFGCKPVGLQPIGILPELHYVIAWSIKPDQRRNANVARWTFGWDSEGQTRRACPFTQRAEQHGWKRTRPSEKVSVCLRLHAWLQLCIPAWLDLNEHKWWPSLCHAATTHPCTLAVSFLWTTCLCQPQSHTAWLWH